MRLNRHTLEMAVALAIVAAAGVTLLGSLQMDTGWGEGGPASGYFPFRLGVILLTVGGLLLVRAWRDRGIEQDELFASMDQLRRSSSLFFPSVVLVCAMPWLGTYLASALFLTWMGRRHGHYSWTKAAFISVVAMLSFYGVFELWFKVPLVQGPLEEWLQGF